MPDDPENLKAALDQLEAERERRIGERLEQGAAVRGSVGRVIGVDDRGHAAPARDEKGREIFYDVDTIITGVPRHGRDEVPPEWYKRQPVPTPDPRERLRKDTRPIPPLPKPEPKVEAPPNPTCVRTETRQRTNDPGDAGEIVEGYFDVRDGQVYVWTVENGARPLGHAPVRPGDDPAVVARRLLRDKVGRGGFWHRLH
jgi:hypothetical protein